MGDNQNIDWVAAVASTLEWWRDAGVDVLVNDVPHDWKAPSQAPAAAVVTTDASPLQDLPDTLAAFLTWRGGPGAPETAWSGVHLSASGPQDAAVMVLVDCPDREDGQSGCLLSGTSGRLFDRMLQSVGLSRETIHLAAVCAKRPASGRASRDVEGRLHELARHHVALVAPRRLLALGDAASRAILSTDAISVRGSSHPFNHRSGETTVVASFHPRLLIDRPGLKAESWRDLRMLVKGLGE